MSKPVSGVTIFAVGGAVIRAKNAEGWGTIA
jgi:hypothetical protein